MPDANAQFQCPMPNAKYIFKYQMPNTYSIPNAQYVLNVQYIFNAQYILNANAQYSIHTQRPHTQSPTINTYSKAAYSMSNAKAKTPIHTQYPTVNTYSKAHILNAQFPRPNAKANAQYPMPNAQGSMIRPIPMQIPNTQGPILDTQ